ncbi:type II and III secretion system protein family protein [Myxococcota bacterium]
MTRTSITVRALFAVSAMTALSAAAFAKSSTVPPKLRIDREVGAVHELRLEAGQNRLLVLSEAIGRVSVANPDVADLKVVTPTQLLLTAKGVGNTDLTLWNKKDEPLVVALLVTRNLEGLRQQLRDLFPEETIGVAAAGDLVILTGEVSDVRLPERLAEVAKLHAGKVANLVKVSGEQQVQLEVKFAEVKRSGLKELGANFFHRSVDYRTNSGMSGPGNMGNFLNNTQSPTVPMAGMRSGPLGRFGGNPPDVPAPAYGDSFSFWISNFNSYFPFAFMLSILESSGMAKTLAEPTLVTLSGQKASFLAGGEIPVPMSASLGQVNVEWKKFGVRLEFTPTVIGKDTVHLHLYTEVSDLDPNTAVMISGYTIPGLTSRQGETTIRLADGQSFAIAGLLSDSVRSQIDRVPLLGHLPILGALFRSTAWQRDETELLVVVTARLARPVAPHEVPPLPTDYEENDLSNFELLLMGWDSTSTSPNSSSSNGHAAALDRRGPVGVVGFVR